MGPSLAACDGSDPELPFWGLERGWSIACQRWGWGVRSAPLSMAVSPKCLFSSSRGRNGGCDGGWRRSFCNWSVNSWALCAARGCTPSPPTAAASCPRPGSLPSPARHFNCFSNYALTWTFKVICEEGEKSKAKGLQMCGAARTIPGRLVGRRGAGCSLCPASLRRLRSLLPPDHIILMFSALCRSSCLCRPAHTLCTGSVKGCC